VPESVALSLASMRTSVDKYDVNVHIQTVLRALFASIGADAKYLDVCSELCCDASITIAGSGDGGGDVGDSTCSVVVTGRVPVILSQFELSQCSSGSGSGGVGAATCRALLCGGGSDSSSSGGTGSSSVGTGVGSVSTLVLLTYVSHTLSSIEK